MSRVISLFLAFFLMGSCVDLEEVTPGQLTVASLYKTQKDLESAAVGLYSPLFGGFNGFDFDWPIVMTAGGEDVDANAGIFAMFDEFRAEPGSGAISTMWTVLYKSINNANNIIGNIDNIPQTESRDQVEGQARFIRALNYFYLTRWFGEIQLITFDNQASAGEVPQATLQEIYDFIVADLLIAEGLLPLSFGDFSARPTKGAAKALLAKVYITMAGWPLNLGTSHYALARDKAAELINGELAGKYFLEDDFSTLWRSNNKFTNSEFIFNLHGISTAGSANASLHHRATRHPEDGGWGDWYSEERFLNAFPEGPRKDASFTLTFSTGNHWSEVNVPGGFPGHPFVAKYRDAGDICPFEATTCPSEGDGFFPILRYADVLLLFAEADNLANGGASAPAYEALNSVRRRAAGLDPASPSPEVDLDGLASDQFDRAVLDERNWELAFEANRWFDLTRRELVEAVNDSIHSGITRSDYFLPKPLVQVEISEGLQQNEGY